MKTKGYTRRQVSQEVAFGFLIAATIIVVLPVIAIIAQTIINGGSAIYGSF